MDRHSADSMPQRPSAPVAAPGMLRCVFARAQRPSHIARSGWVDAFHQSGRYTVPRRPAGCGSGGRCVALYIHTPRPAAVHAVHTTSTPRSRVAAAKPTCM